MLSWVMPMCPCPCIHAHASMPTCPCPLVHAYVHVHVLSMSFTARLLCFAGRTLHSTAFNLDRQWSLSMIVSPSSFIPASAPTRQHTAFSLSEPCCETQAKNDLGRTSVFGQCQSRPRVPPVHACAVVLEPRPAAARDGLMKQ